MDKRLQAHQEAFTLWRELFRTVHNEGISEVVMKCQDWWEKNCVYLSKEASEAFVAAYGAAVDHRENVKARLPVDQITTNFNDLRRAGNIILMAVALPGLPEGVKKQDAAQESAAVPSAG